MRTTLTIDDDIFSLVKNKAQEEQISLGKALSLLVRNGMAPKNLIPKMKNGLPLFKTRSDKIVTPEMIAQDEEY